MPLSQQELEEGLAHQRQIAHELRRRLHVLELQRAQQGQQVLPQVVLEIESLTEEIQTHELAIARLERLLSAFPPPLSPVVSALALPSGPRDERRSNLPAQSTALVGRKKEVAAVCDLLRRTEVRLLTLTGPGGIGKTRLAIQAAADLLQDFANGVCFVGLAPISDPGLVVTTIAQALGVKEAAGRSLTDQLKDYLREKRMLLVLDNFEQVTDVAPLLSELLAVAPGLKELVTSRVVLHLYGEHEFDVPPLALPPRHLHPSPPSLAKGEWAQALPLSPAWERGSGGEGNITQYEAVRLFAEQARAVKLDFVVTDENASAIAEICARLDGLPLAIELAAARIKLFSPQALLTRIDNRLKLLTGGPRDLPARQQTIRGAIDWSYNLLDEGEKTLFARLGVFVGGCTIEAAEAVCNASGDLPLDVIDGLTALVDQSLLKQVEGPDGEPRFTMLETIREYALERLAERGEAELLRRRHASYYLRLSEEAEPKLHGAEEALWLDRLEVEHDNLRAALAWSPSAQGNVEIGLQLAGALWPFWRLRGYLSEGRDWLARLLALVQGSGVSASVQGKALHGAGALANDQSDYAQALMLSRESLALFRELNDKRGMALALDELGFVAQQQGDYERARALHEEGLALFRELGEKLGIANVLHSLGRVARDQGDHPRATALYQESLVLFRELGDRGNIALALNSLGLMAWRTGDYAAARVLFEQSLVLCQELGDILGIANTLNHLGLVAREQGDYAAARALFEQSLTVQREQGRTMDIALSLHDLGAVARHQGDYGRAHALLEESLVLLRQLGDQGTIGLVLSNLGQLAQLESDFRRAAELYKESLLLYRKLGNSHEISWCLAELAGLAQAHGQPEQAIRLFGAAAALRAVASVPSLPAFEHVVAAARAQLDDATFAAAWAAGQALTLDQAIAEALALAPG